MAANEADSREKLEVDVGNTVCGIYYEGYNDGAVENPGGMRESVDNGTSLMLKLLDRQAAITERKCQLEYDAVAYDRDYFRKHVGQMNEFIEKLVAECDELKKVVHIQAESFKKLELELKEAKDALRQADDVDQLDGR